MNTATEKRTCTVVQDPMVLIMLAILFPIMTFGSFFFVLMTIVPIYPTVGSAVSTWFIRIMFTICGLTLPALLLIEPTRYVVWITFTPKRIEYHTIARRNKLVPYSEVPYIMHGSYLHTVYFRAYILFSSRRFSTRELTEINEIRPAEHMIKIKYSKRMLKKLLPALPAQQRVKVAAIAEVIEKKKASPATRQG